MWIQVEDTIREHDKIYNLSDELGIPDAYAIGLMVCLWTWASSNAPDGDLTSFPPRAIASAAKWDKSGAKAASRFYDALLEVQLLERLEDGRVVIRNWEKHATLIMDYAEQQREKTNERVKRYRDRKKKQKPASETEQKAFCNVTQLEKCNVTETLQNGDVTPIPYHTIPYHTINNITTSNNNPALIPAEGNVTTDVTAALRCVCDEFSSAVHEPNEKEREQLRLLLGEYSEPALMAAIQDAKGKGRSVNYLRTILENWKRTGTAPPEDKHIPETSFDLDEYERTSRWGYHNHKGGDEK